MSKGEIAKFKNPFQIVNTDDYMEDWKIVSQFALPPQVFEKFNSNRDAILSGSRGTGKSMMLRFFSFKTHADYYKKYRKKHVLFNDLNVIGPYLQMRGGSAPIGQSDTIFMGEEGDRYMIAQFNIMFLEKLGNELQFAQSCGLISKSDEIFLAFPFLFAPNEKKNWDNFFRSIDKERTNLLKAWSSETDLSKDHWFNEPTILNEVASSIVYNGYTKKKSLAILIDEAERLSENQKKVLNTFILLNKPPLCFKIGTLPYRLARNSLSGIIEARNDFDLCEIEREIDKYSEFLKELCQRRLFESYNKYIDVENDILGEEYSPQRDDFQKEILEKSQESNNQEFKFVQETLNKSIIEKEKKLLDSEILETRKGLMKYYGFTTCARLSSGVARNFIILIKSILLTANTERNWNFGKEVIDSDLQNQIIKKESENFKMQAYEGEDFTDIFKVVDHFGEKCHQRFWGDKSGEGECIRIEIKDFLELRVEIRNLLNKCVAYGLLQEQREKRRSTFNQGMGSAKIYLLNKLLAPAYLIPPVDHQTVRMKSSDLNTTFMNQERLEVFGRTVSKDFDRIIDNDKAHQILKDLYSLPNGQDRKKYVKYHEIVRSLFSYLFDDLILVEDGSNHYDDTKNLIFQNEGVNDNFWKNIKEKHQSNHIIVEVINNTEPKSEIFDEIAGFLNETNEFLSIVVIRGVNEIPSYLKTKAMTIFQNTPDPEKKKLLLIINDRDLTEMYRRKIGNNPPSTILQEKYNQII